MEEQKLLNNNNPKFKVLDGILHYNDIHYPFIIINIDINNKVYSIIPLGNNAIGNTSNIVEVPFDIIHKEFHYFEVPKEILL